MSHISGTATKAQRRDNGVTIVGPTSTLVVNGGGGGGGGGGGLTTDQKIAIGIGVPGTVFTIIGTVVMCRRRRRKANRNAAKSPPRNRSNRRLTAQGSSRGQYGDRGYQMQPVEAQGDQYNDTQAELPGQVWHAELGH